MANLPAICVVRKILSSEYQPDACGKIFARLDLDPIGLFLDGHYLVSVRNHMELAFISSRLCAQ
jgi:hypothetical protein